MQQVNEQYKNADNLKSRIGIYNFTTSDLTLHQWISSLIPRQNKIRILELGCGTGLLWKSLIVNFPNSEIILSDMSENMLKESEKNLNEFKLKYEKIDYHSIPYSAESFDLIISNHNLYHAENISLVLSEIKRTLKSNGTFICSTNSRNHLVELKEILCKYGINSFWPNQNLIEKFGMENGESLLSPFFSSISAYHYKNKLHITNPDAVINYLLSVGNIKINKLINEKREDIVKEVQSEIETGIFFKVHARPGIFICHK
jgi:ubiquinone/menaquinone biosynthesis C-methylase UbiE